MAVLSVDRNLWRFSALRVVTIMRFICCFRIVEPGGILHIRCYAVLLHSGMRLEYTYMVCLMLRSSSWGFRKRNGSIFSILLHYLLHSLYSLTTCLRQVDLQFIRCIPYMMVFSTIWKRPCNSFHERKQYGNDRFNQHFKQLMTNSSIITVTLTSRMGISMLLQPFLIH